MRDCIDSLFVNVGDTRRGEERFTSTSTVEEDEVK
jgi:hypothetical protein